MIYPAPKPEPRPKKARTPLQSSSRPPRGTKARNPQRKNREWTRAYGSAERVAFIRELPCIVCDHCPCENAHIVNGGIGRKADATLIVPLCRLHHAEQHHFGIETFAARHGLDLLRCAAKVRDQWAAFSGGAAGGEQP